MHKPLKCFDGRLACGFNWAEGAQQEFPRWKGRMCGITCRKCVWDCADWTGDAFVAIAGKRLNDCITYGKKQGLFQTSSRDVSEFIFIFSEVISVWWDTWSTGTFSLSRCSFSFQSIWFNFNAHIGSLSWICMDQLNPGWESYTIDKKMALLMHGIFDCRPFQMC